MIGLMKRSVSLTQNAYAMKRTNEITYGQVVWTALLIELILAAAQFMYLTMYTRANPVVVVALPADYLRAAAFFVFQFTGILFYAFVVYLIAMMRPAKPLNKVLALVVIGGIIELSVYIMMQTAVGGAVIFSFLDKILAAALGLMLYNFNEERAMSEPRRGAA